MTVTGGLGLNFSQPSLLSQVSYEWSVLQVNNISGPKRCNESHQRGNQYWQKETKRPSSRTYAVAIVFITHPDLEVLESLSWVVSPVAAWFWKAAWMLSLLADAQGLDMTPSSTRGTCISCITSNAGVPVAYWAWAGKSWLCAGNPNHHHFLKSTKKEGNKVCLNFLSNCGSPHAQIRTLTGGSMVLLQQEFPRASCPLPGHEAGFSSRRDAGRGSTREAQAQHSWGASWGLGTSEKSPGKGYTEKPQFGK